MDLLVHLSRREGLPRSIPQALATGIPVVAYDCDGAREACLHNETGFLVQPGDLASLKRHVLQLASNPALRQQLGHNGRQFVEKNFSTRQMVDNLAHLYQNLHATLQSLAK
jgi:glycosyltransferase involved in cell wall biosynthesis